MCDINYKWAILHFSKGTNQVKKCWPHATFSRLTCVTQRLLGVKTWWRLTLTVFRRLCLQPVLTLLPVPSESLCEYSSARMVPRVQPEDGAGRDGGGLSECLQGRFPRCAAPHCQHGRRQRQHGLALQRFTLQLPRGEEAPGCRWGLAGQEQRVVGVRRERELGLELPWHLIFTEKSSQSKEIFFFQRKMMEKYVVSCLPCPVPREQHC